MPTHRITKPYTIRSKTIIFNGEMVRAILEGKKTQTRRVIKVEWSRCLDFDEPEDLKKAVEQCPYGKEGDFLWVRESIRRRELAQGYVGATYLADLTAVTGRGSEGSYCGRAICDWKWKRDTLASIHMPRWASRITLEITEVRVQQIRQISYDDVIKEGIERDRPNVGQDLRRKFMDLWDSINQARGFGWNKNPWCWCISFRRINDETNKLS